MDTRSLQMYKEALSEGKEKVYNIRVMVVGQYGVGKTTLTQRLLGKYVNISEKHSTDGIDVHIECFKVSMPAGEWTTQETNVEQYSRLQRLVKVLNERAQKQESKGEQERQSEMDDMVTSEEHDNEHPQHDQLVSAEQDKFKPPLSQPIESHVASVGPENDKDIVMEILKLVNEYSDKLEKSMVEYAALALWDFAGQYVFYTTHQTFLTSRAIYLLVIDLSQQVTDLIKDDECFLDTEGIKLCKVHDLIEIWMNSIHSCATSSKPGIPPVILVGTHVDKIPEKSRQEVILEYFLKIRHMLKNKPVIFHLMDSIAIDNTQCDPKLEDLKRRIFELASQQPHWGEEKPARWLPLEQVLMTLKASGVKIFESWFSIGKLEGHQNRTPKRSLSDFHIGQWRFDFNQFGTRGHLLYYVRKSWNPEIIMVAPLSLIEEINMSSSIKIEDRDELEVFLCFQHEIGTILYFSAEGLREKIVLDPQWMIDALKSLITAEMFIMQNPTVTKKWYAFKEKGKLTHELIDAIWTKKEKPDFHDNKEHIILVMEKLNIIARPMSYTMDGKSVKREDYYLAPCMLRQATPKGVICPKSGPEKESTSALCFVCKGKFLPTPIFHRLVGACLTRWPIAKKKSENLIYCGCCVYDLDHHHRLTLHFFSHVIFARVTGIGVTDMSQSSKLCIEVRKFILENLLKIIGNLGQSFQFEIQLQCPNCDADSLDGLLAVPLLQKHEKVVCHSHDESHPLVSRQVLKFWFEDEGQPVVEGTETGKVSEIGEIASTDKVPSTSVKKDQAKKVIGSEEGIKPITPETSTKTEQKRNSAVLKDQTTPEECPKSLQRRALPPGKKYHAFFSYSTSDIQWVKQTVETLENDHGFFCCEYDRDNTPGTPLLKFADDSILNAYKTVVVMTREAFQSAFVLHEIQMAINLGFSESRNCVVPVLLEDCEVPRYLSVLNYVDARDINKRNIWWPKLLMELESKEVEGQTVIEGIGAGKESKGSVKGEVSSMDRVPSTSIKKGKFNTNIQDQILPQAHDVRAKTKSFLSKLYQSKGKFNTNIQDQILPQAHDVRAKTKSFLSKLYQSKGKFNTNIQDQILPQAHDVRAKTKSFLSKLYQSKGKFNTNIQDQILPQAHDVRAKTKSFLSKLYQSKGVPCSDPKLLCQILHKSHQAASSSQTTLKANCLSVGLELHGETPADGNCFFEAVSSQLRRLNCVVQKSPQQLRQEVVAFMKTNRVLQASEGTIHLDSFVYESFDDYCTQMAREGEWADHVVVVAMARMLQIDIMIVTSSPSSGPEDIIVWVVGQTAFQGDPILLGHVWESHYQSLQPIGDKTLDVMGRDERIEHITPERSTQMEQADVLTVVEGKRAGTKSKVSEKGDVTSIKILHSTSSKKDSSTSELKRRPQTPVAPTSVAQTTHLSNVQTSTPTASTRKVVPTAAPTTKESAIKTKPSKACYLL